MAQVSTYYTKLLSLRSTMSMLTARSVQLQRRADKLKSTKIQYLSQIDTIKRTEQARDQNIAARIAVSPSSSSNLSPSTSSSLLKLPKRQKEQQEQQKESTTTTPSPSSSSSPSPIPQPSSPSSSSSKASPVPDNVPSDTVIAVAKKIKKKKPKVREVKIAEGGTSEGWSPKKKK